MTTTEEKNQLDTNDDNNDNNDNIDDTGTYQEIKIGQSVFEIPRYNDNQQKIKKNKSKKKCDCPIFLPYGRFIFWWDAFLTVLLLFSIIEIPYFLAFSVKSSAGDPIVIIEFLIDLCLLFDIWINFRTAFIDQYDRLRVIVDTKLIAKRYISTWLIIDFLSSAPFSYIVFIFTNDTINTLRYLSILRVLKLFRIIKVFKKFHHFRETSIHIPSLDGRKTKTMLRLIKILFVMIIVSHYFACLWYGIGNWALQKNELSWINNTDSIKDRYKEMSNFELYSISYYWSIITLFTTGYGMLSIYFDNLSEMTSF